MKKTNLLLALIAFAFASCQSWPTVSYSDEFSKSLSVNSATTTLGASDVLDCGQSANYKKYGKKINSITIERATYQLTAFSAPAGTPAQTMSGTIKISDGASGTTYDLATFTNVDLASLLNKETDLVLNSTAVDKAQTFIKDNCKLGITVAATTNRGPINLTIQMKFYAKAVARVIGSN
jgi:hypothetical protein